MYMYECMYACAPHACVYLQRPEDIMFAGARVIVGCAVGAEN